MSDGALLLQAIRNNPQDEFSRKVYADWLEEHGNTRAAEWWRSGEMTGNTFKASIIAQHDDEDYDESGWVACVIGDTAFLGRYGHCSCYGTWESLCGGGIGDFFVDEEIHRPTWDWVGAVPELVELARGKKDPSFPSRDADPHDYDYDHLLNVYQQILTWDEKRAA